MYSVTAGAYTASSRSHSKVPQVNQVFREWPVAIGITLSITWAEQPHFLLLLSFPSPPQSDCISPWGPESLGPVSQVRQEQCS